MNKDATSCASHNPNNGCDKARLTLYEGRAYFRIRRNNRWLSACLDDLDYITDLELMEMPPILAKHLLERLEQSNDWQYDYVLYMWSRSTSHG